MSDAPGILLVDDDPACREVVTLLLQNAGHPVVAHASGEAALAALKARAFGLLLLDYQLPGMNGYELLLAARNHQADTPALFITGALNLEQAVKITQQGVAGIFTKPVDPAVLLRKVAEALRPAAPRPTGATRGPLASPTPPRPAVPFVAAPARAASDGASRPFTLHHFAGASPAARKFVEQLGRIRDFRSVLFLLGPEGAVFDDIARDVVENSLFATGPLLVCLPGRFGSAALVELLAPLLVVDEPGTVLITGLDQFTVEQHGLLDELLGARGVFMPFAQRFRLIVGATPRLAVAVDEGRFDENLYYRLSSVQVTVPTLAELRDDLVPCARRWLEQIHRLDPRRPAGFTADAAAWIEAQPWPGDFSQLREIVRHAAHRATAPELTAAALDQALLPAAEPPPSVTSPAPIPPAPPTLPVEATVPAPPPVAPAAPSRDGLTRYLPSHLTAEELAEALTPEPRPDTAPVRPRSRKAPGSYDFEARLRLMLADTKPAPAQ